MDHILLQVIEKNSWEGVISSNLNLSERPNLRLKANDKSFEGRESMGRNDISSSCIYLKHLKPILYECQITTQAAKVINWRDGRNYR